jgi:hypothetical protein
MCSELLTTRHDLPSRLFPRLARLKVCADQSSESVSDCSLIAFLAWEFRSGLGTMTRRPTSPSPDANPGKTCFHGLYPGIIVTWPGEAVERTPSNLPSTVTSLASLRLRARRRRARNRHRRVAFHLRPRLRRCSHHLDANDSGSGVSHSRCVHRLHQRNA